MIRSLCVVLLSLTLYAFPVTCSTPSSSAVETAAAQPPEGQTEFRPLSEVPRSEQLPGGALVVVAYSFIWAATMVYIWFLWRRLHKVEDEMRTLQKRSEAESNRR